MNRIKKKFEEIAQLGKKALIPYTMPEFPLQGATLPVMQALERSGADLLEVGMPFSDPLADGKTIQHSSEIALRNGATIPKILETVKQFRSSSTVPVLLMGYVNPVLQFGIKKFCEECSFAGVDGLIIPDLPPEESAELIHESNATGISNVFLIAPTTPVDRIREIDGLSTDFSYCVSVTGVTGVRSELEMNGSLAAFLARVKENVKKPFVVGFGISTAEQVERVCEFADGAVVGSALLQTLNGAKTIEESVQRAEAFLRELRKR